MQYEKEFLRNLYRNLLDMRLLEQKMVDTYAQGRVPGHIHSGVGQEASFVGVLANYKEGDYYKRTHRLTAVPYMMGTSLDTFFGELLAKTTGNLSSPRCRSALPLHIGNYTAPTRKILHKRFFSPF